LITGKEKAQLLISVLGPQAKSVLQFLGREEASILTGSIQNSPSRDSRLMLTVLKEAMAAVERPEAVSAPISTVQEPESVTVSDPMASDDFFNEDVVSSELMDEGSPVPEPENKTDYSVIARHLENEKPQLVAFFLSRLDDGIRSQLLPYLPSNLTEQLSQMAVEAIPLSDKVFEIMYQKLFHPN